MEDSQQVVEELVATFSAGDLDRAMALYHDEAMFLEFPSHPEPTTGVDQIREVFANAAARFSDIALETLSVVTEGNRLATVTRQTARYSTSIEGFPQAAGLAAAPGTA